MKGVLKMKKDEKKTYAALALNIEIISENDIISTSTAFPGEKDEIFKPASRSTFSSSYDI